MGRKRKQAADYAADQIHLKWLKHKNGENNWMFALQMAGAGLENQTRAGMNVQLNVCYNKKALL